jgi:hypothetical protein
MQTAASDLRISTIDRKKKERKRRNKQKKEFNKISVWKNLSEKAVEIQ